MSGAPRGGRNYADRGYYNPHTGSNNIPQLRQPTLTQAEIRAATKLGFSDKYLPSSMSGNGAPNGRGGPSYSAGDNNAGFPEIGEFCAEDYVDAQHQQNNSHQQQQQHHQGEEEGMLPPLRRPHVNEIPADTLAILVKDERFEEILVPSQNPQQVPHIADRSFPIAATKSQDPRPQSQTTPGRNNNVYYQSQPPVSHHQSPQPQPSQYTPVSTQNYKMMQNSSATPSSASGRQSNIRVQLSANAKEFIPSMASSPSSGSGSNALMTTQEESELAQAVAQFQEFQLQTHSQPDLIDFNQGARPTSQSQETGVDDSSDYILSTVTDSIMDLTNHPANFARCAKTVTEVLKNFCMDLDTLNVVCTLIVEQSVSNPNFCYSGARLAEVLIRNGITVNKTTFKSVFLGRCQEVFLSCITQMHNDAQLMLRSRGLLMYFGELFMNIRIESSPGVETPLQILGLGALEMMDNLIKHPSHENIKCVVQILKLVGWDLENSTAAKVKLHFDQLMKDMSYLCLASTDITPQTKALLDNLFDLKNKKWNREDDSSEGSGKSPHSSVSSSGPTNNPPNVYELPDSDDDFEDNDCILLDDEPDEVQRAYEEFLKTVK